MEWITVGEPKNLPPSRLILHWAAQLPSAVGNTLAPKKSDDSQMALVWDAGTLASTTIGVDWAALRLADLTLLAKGQELALADKTMADALAWLGKRFGSTIELPKHELPDHEIGKGATFPAAARAAYADLSAWFGNAALVLDAVRAAQPKASPVRCWPHHFDIATLIQVDEKKSVGVGLSPGDKSYTDPYFYVTPWPYPERSTLPALPNAAWHTSGWTGAVLQAKAIAAADDQRGATQSFLDAAIAACLELLSVSVH